MLESQNTVTKMKNSFDKLISRLDRARKESLSLKIYQQKLPKLKSKEKKDWKKSEQNIQRLWDNHKRCNIHVMGIPEGEER